MAVFACRTTYKNLYENLGRALASLGYEPTNERVLLKPCLATSRQSIRGSAWTNRRVVEALVQIFPDRLFTVAEGVPPGQDYETIMRKSGYFRLAREYPQVELLNLDVARRRKVEWEHGQLEIPEVLFTHEYINMPTLHTHMVAGVSLGLKNQKGLLRDSDKKRFHKEGLHKMIVSLGKAVKPKMTIIDGIEGAQGDWPMPTSTKKRSNLLICGDDNFETDRAACMLMGIDPATIPHIGPGEVKFIEKEMKGLTARFRPVKTRDSIKLMRFNVPLDPSTCTACANAGNESLMQLVLWPQILMLPYTLWRLLYFCVLNRTYIVMGSKPITPKRPCKVICIGDCTRKFARDNNYYHLPGCSPSIHEVRKTLMRASIPTVR